MSEAVTRTRNVPKKVYGLSLASRMKWARVTAGLSHDRLVEKLGRSNRGHLIKIEQGLHVPRTDLRDAWADATEVPRDLFADDEDEEADPVSALMNVLRHVVRVELAKSHDPTPIAGQAAGAGSQRGGL